jgi:hypothetical protein
MAVDSHVFIALTHILLFVPFLLYVGIERMSVPGYVYTILLALGAIVFIYHAYKAFVRLTHGSPYAWVNIVHAAIIGPLMFFIGFKGRDTPRWAYELLLMVGFAGLGYHLFSLIRSLQVYNADKAEKLIALRGGSGSA